MRLAKADLDRAPVAAFDIGGTRLRDAIVGADGHIIQREEFATRDALDETATSADGRLKRLIAHIVDRTEVLMTSIEDSLSFVSLSLGACINDITGEVYGSGPLFGSDIPSLNLLQALRDERNDVSWFVLNDVSAATLHASVDPEVRDADRFLLVSIGSGIAARVCARGVIPVERDYGIQGEIGHLPAYVQFADLSLPTRCDCGGDNHVASFSSGNAMRRILSHIDGEAPQIGKALLREAGLVESDSDQMAVFQRACARRGETAIALLTSILSPLASVLKTAFTMDPLIEKLVLRGGIVDLFGVVFLQCLAANMDGENGLYVIGRHEPDYFARRLIHLSEARSDGVAGAALYCRNCLRFAA